MPANRSRHTAPATDRSAPLTSPTTPPATSSTASPATSSPALPTDSTPTPPACSPTPPENTLPARLTLDDTDTPADVIDALFLGRFTTGEEPYSRSHSVDRVKKGSTLLPDGAHVLREARSDGRSTTLAEGEGWTVLVSRWTHGADVTVTAVSDELAEQRLREAVDGAEDEPEPQSDSVSMGFWYHSPMRGPRRTTRTITAETWDEVRPNYTARVAESMDELMKVTPEDVSGRLLLLHGPPGTGKTSALRTLARSWRDWCQVDCVLDPEHLFNNIGYLMDIAIGADDTETEQQRWRLLLLEDCDELIRGEAKHAAGQALSRLLNLTDGLLGQGRNVLVGVTTNEDLERLHPAVVRPGRCLARIEVGQLSREEATGWLGTDEGIGRDGATLAELFALRKGNGPASVPAQHGREGAGLYL